MGVNCGSYFNFNGAGFVCLTFDFNSGLTNGKLASSCWRKKVGIGFRKSSFAVYPLVAHRLIRTHNYSKPFKVWGDEIIAVFIHFKINSQALIYPQLLLTELCFKCYLSNCAERK